MHEYLVTLSHLCTRSLFYTRKIVNKHFEYSQSSVHLQMSAYSQFAKIIVLENLRLTVFVSKCRSNLRVSKDMSASMLSLRFLVAYTLLARP